VGKIDFLRDTCTLQIFFDVTGNQLNNYVKIDNIKESADDDDD
jgi:hypothetical protein